MQHQWVSICGSTMIVSECIIKSYSQHYTINDVIDVCLPTLENYKRILLVCTILAAILAVVLLWFNIRMRRRPVKDHVPLYDTARSHTRHPLEIKANSIKLQGIIGEGAFGVVHKGYLKSLNQYVAVKMLKGNVASE